MEDESYDHLVRNQIEFGKIAHYGLGWLPPEAFVWSNAGADCQSAGVAVGTAIAARPPHRPVLALLTHTVPASDVWVFSVESLVWIG
ncbi:MAG: hypothetical protein ACR2NN_13865, partial [Bryobacteraceae bacterium]